MSNKCLLPCTWTTTQPHHSPCLHAAHYSKHAANHGNAFNPDTGEIAEYGALSHSSNDAHWQAANVPEIHQLAQGTQAAPGTNTMFHSGHGPTSQVQSNLLVHRLCTLPQENSAPLHLLDHGWQPGPL